MTSLSSLHTHSATTPPPDGRQKDVLFCPNCGHESPIGGNWLLVPDSDQLRCPECRSVLGAHGDE